MEFRASTTPVTVEARGSAVSIAAGDERAMRGMRVTLQLLDGSTATYTVQSLFVEGVALNYVRMDRENRSRVEMRSL